MNPTAIIAWFEEIACRSIPYHERHGQWEMSGHDHKELARWYADAASALAQTFPPGHAVRVHWDGTVTPGDLGGMAQTVVFEQAQAIFQSALAQLKAGRLTSLAQSIQAETVSELLDQAEALLAGGYAVAAAVIAGGALETHLCHLCHQNRLSWNGDGSISKYDGAIAQERNKTGQGIYSVADSKSVIAWGGKRNDAAHDPGGFAHTNAEVRLMVDGLRQFIARTSR